MLSCASIAIPLGLLNVAAVPVPLAEPTVPLPAKVVTSPAGVIFLIALFPKSATNTFPLLSTHVAFGALKVALVPVPFANPEVPEPANVLTVNCALEKLLKNSADRLNTKFLKFLIIAYFLIILNVFTSLLLLTTFNKKIAAGKRSI